MRFSRELSSSDAGEAPLGSLEGFDAGALLAASPAALWLVDVDGALRWANAAASASPVCVLPASIGQPLAALLELPEADAVALGAFLGGPDGEFELTTGSSAGTVQLRLASRRLAAGGHLLAPTATTAVHALRAEADRLRELLDVAQDLGRLAVWERDPKTLRGRWDRRLYRFWGLEDDGRTPDLGEAVSAIVEPDRAELESVFAASLFWPGSHSHRYRVRAPDGRLRSVHSQWVVKPGDGVRAPRVLGVMSDDTQASNLAQSRDELSSQLALAGHIEGLALWRHDLRTQRVHYNAEACALIGLPPREDGMSIEEVRSLMHPEDLPRVLEATERILQGAPSIDLETRHRHADGSWRSFMTRRVAQFDADGGPIAVLGIALDVTERQRSEQALRAAAERALLTARGVGLGSWELRLADGHEVWDEQMWVLRGLAPRAQAMSEAEWLAIVHPEDRAEVQRQFRESLALETTTNYEFRIIRADGALRWLASRSAPVRDAQGRVTGRVGVNWDITDRRGAETLRYEREIALRESQAKSAFLARMSHELRTPLNAVLGFTELLLADEGAGTASADVRARRLQHIHEAGRQLLTLTDGLLDLTRLNGGARPVVLEPVPLAPLVAELLPMFAAELVVSGVRLQAAEIDVAPMAHAHRLRQVLLDVLDNAIRYNRIDGQVTIEASRDADRVVVRVADTGRGLSQQQLQQLFQPRAASDLACRARIGLPVARSLIELMGGRLQVQSQLGVGSVVTIELAAAAPPPPAAAEPAAPAGVQAAAPALRGTLLYIEDNPVNAMIVAELIARRPDLRLHVAEDGESGVAMARELRPDLVLLDMQLPDIDGLEVLRRLRADPSTAHIRCIALSANALPQDIDTARRAGMDDYWTKPLDFRQFMASIEALFGSAR